MGSSSSNPLEPLPDVRPHLEAAKWKTNDSFDPVKAFVCSVYSEYAYRYIADVEIDKDHRIKVIPCDTYAWLIINRVAQEVRAIFAESLGEHFVIETDDLIAVGIATDAVIIIAIRGTAPWYSPREWRINLNGLRARPSGVTSGIFFHKGFYEAIKNLREPLSKRLCQWQAKRLPIYVTGHSLGGAMSAVLNACWRDLMPSEYEAGLIPTGTYTFGMPRYGNFDAMSKLPCPYHVYHPRDLVPTLPGRRLGFADGSREYALHSKGLLSGSRAKTRLRFRGAWNHAIERYRKRLQGLLPSNGR
jgi:predicted lipase